FEDELENLVGNQFFPKHVAFFNCPSNTTFYSNSVTMCQAVYLICCRDSAPPGLPAFSLMQVIAVLVHIVAHVLNSMFHH
ncbi:MAG: hypothetical protein WBH50_02060, partial [Fuerstiella sp.]